MGANDVKLNILRESAFSTADARERATDFVLRPQATTQQYLRH